MQKPRLQLSCAAHSRLYPLSLVLILYASVFSCVDWISSSVEDSRICELAPVIQHWPHSSAVAWTSSSCRNLSPEDCPTSSRFANGTTCMQQCWTLGQPLGLLASAICAIFVGALSIPLTRTAAQYHVTINPTRISWPSSHTAISLPASR
jgi:hypothetical protein